MNVARASLDELLLDYEDFLRQRGLRQWGKDDPQAQVVRGVGPRLIGLSGPIGLIRPIGRIRPIGLILKLTLRG